MGKGFLEFAKEADPDILCIQETKMQEGQAEVPLDGYHQYWCSAEKKGYSGTAVFTKEEPVSVRCGIGIEEHDHEGRMITAEYEKFYLVNVYVPNSQNELKRLDYRMRWEDDFRAYLKKLEESKPVITCGDFNVAFQEIDLKNPKTNRKNAGFTDEERAKMGELQDAGFIRHFPVFLSGSGRCVFLVELSLQRPQEQRGVAYRLFSGVRKSETGFEKGGDPDRRVRQRSLSGESGSGVVA